MTQNGNWRVGRMMGVPLSISPLWVVVTGMVTWSLATEFFPARDPGLSTRSDFAAAALCTALLVISVLAHEAGHIATAHRRGVAIAEIELWVLGGEARLAARPRTAADEARFALAGPAVSAALAVAFAALRLALGDAAPWLTGTADYLAVICALTVLVNLVPAFPLDGGRGLRAHLWARSGDPVRATRHAASIGHALGIVMAMLGFISVVVGSPEGIWFVLVGGFATIRCRTALRSATTTSAAALRYRRAA